MYFAYKFLLGPLFWEVGLVHAHLAGSPPMTLTVVRKALLHMVATK